MRYDLFAKDLLNHSLINKGIKGGRWEWEGDVTSGGGGIRSH